ncbi:MAG TPA: thioesterase family protein [Anaerolineales bacterium]|nr:thioesterase family protein [Anaerolineales bacterium]
MTDYKFTHPIEIRYGDLDPQGHLNNARYLTFFEQARIHYFIHLKLFEKNTSFLDIGMILADVHISFLAPVQFADDILVSVKTTRLGNKSMTMRQSLVDQATGKEVCSGEFVLVAYDYHSGKSVPIPNQWREILTRFENLS